MPDGAGDPVRGMSMREPPSNVRAEQALLGAVLANNKALDAVSFLRGEHFYDPLHGRIFDAVLERSVLGGVADAVTLAPLFAHDPMMAEGGGAGAVFAGLVASMISITGAETYGRAVLDAWAKRQGIQACVEFVNAAFGGEGQQTSFAQAMEALDSRLLRIAEGAGDETPLVSFGGAYEQQLSDTEAASHRSSPLAGLSTGYAALDRMTTGLCKGDYILLGARPSMGKTALGLGIAVRAAMNGAPVLFWSGEMSPRKVAARAAAAYAGLSTTSVFTARKWDLPSDAQGQPLPLDGADWAKLKQGEMAARTLPLQFDGRPGLSVQGLRARARRMKRSKAGLQLIVLDYIGLMGASGGNPPRNLYERLTEISRELVALKKELDVPILVLAQLSRASEGRDDKMPQMSDLRDSGALEQDADVIMTLHRPHYYLSRSQPQRRQNETEAQYIDRVTVHEQLTAAERGRAQVNVLKNRSGGTGMTRLLFHDATTWFRDESEDHDSPAWSGRIGI